MLESPPRHSPRPFFPTCSKASVGRWALRTILALAGAGLFVGVLRTADVGRALGLIGASPGLWVVVIPASLAAFADAEAWRRLLAACGSRVSYWILVRTRLSAEAVATTLPWGSVLGEGTALCLLRARCGLPASRILAVLLSRRLYVAFAHGLVLGAAAVVSFELEGAGPRLLRAGLQWAAPAGAFALVGFATLAPRLALRDSLARRFPAFSSSLRASRTPALAPLSPVTGFLIFMWLTESVESFLVLRALGAPFGFAQVFAWDILVSLVRSLAFFSPAGLGFQDASYMAILAGTGRAEDLALGAAFVLVKRAREWLFAAVGYALLLPASGAGRPGLEGHARLAAWSAP